MSSTNEFPCEKFDEIAANPNDFRLLERVPLTSTTVSFPYRLAADVGDEIEIAVIDLETTGLDTGGDSPIEVGLVVARISPSTAQVTEIKSVLSQLEDPGFPLPEIIPEITGITDEMLDGTRFDEASIEAELSSAPLIVAHNAEFDRPFFEKRFANLSHLPWACSIKQIDWGSLGHSSRKLEAILSQLGFFYESHRASIDCLAVVWMLHKQPEALNQILENSKKTSVLVQAFGSPFDCKDTLKANGYSWHDGKQGANKHWWKEVDETVLAKEQVFLDATYHRGSERANYQYITAYERYKQK